MKKLVDEIKSKNAQAADDIRKLREENERLKVVNSKLEKELENRPSVEEILSRFRGTPAYYEELNDRDVEKIKICWRVASRYLADNPGGNIGGFLQASVADKEKLLSEKAMASGEGTSQVAPDSTSVVDSVSRSFASSSRISFRHSSSSPS